MGILLWATPATSLSDPSPADADLIAPAEFAGDLDGDGLADLVALGSRQRDGKDWKLVRAWRGIDGSELWTFEWERPGFNGVSAGPVGSAYLENHVIDFGMLPLRRDLNGDGGADVLFLVERYDFSSASLVCAGLSCLARAWAGTRAFEILALSGQDGVAMWSRTFEEDFVSLWWPSPNALIRTGRYGDLIVMPELDDHDGDGLPDLVVNIGPPCPGCRGTIELAPAGGVSTVLRGLDGEILYRFDWDESLKRGAFLQSAGDAVGDGRADLLLDSCEVEDRCRVEMINAGTFEPAWSWEFSWSGGCCKFFRPLGVDVDGDGKTDLFGADPTGSAWAAVWSGGSGEVLWTSASFVYPIGAIGGPPGVDLAIFTQPAPDSIRIDRLDGATGDVLFGTLHAFPVDVDLQPQAFSMSDLDGDGINDLVLRAPAARPARPRTFLVVESGADGTSFYGLDSQVGASTFPYPVGDLDANGWGDLLVRRTETSGSCPPGARTLISYTAVFLPDGALAWSLEACSASSPRLEAVGDANGNGTADVLWARSGVTEVIEGADGSVIWRLGSPA